MLYFHGSVRRWILCCLVKGTNPTVVLLFRSTDPVSGLVSFSIDVPSVSDSLNFDDLRFAENLVDDAIISNPDAVGALRTGKFLHTVRERIFCELSDRLDHARNLMTRETADVFLGGVAPLKAKARHPVSSRR